MVALAHVPRDYGEDPGEGGHWDEGGQRRHEEKDTQHQGDVDERRDGGAGAVLDAGGRARDCPGGRDAAEQRACHVGHALPDEFLVGVVALARHAVRDDGGEEGLDGAEHGDGDGAGEHFADDVKRHRGKVGRREPRGNRELRADGDDVHVREVRARVVDEGREHDQRDDGAGDAWGEALDALDDCDGSKGDCQSRRTQQAVHHPFEDLPSFEERLGRWMGEADAEEIRELTGEDDDRNAGCESRRHRVRNELDDGTQAKDAGQHEERAANEGRYEQVDETLARMESFELVDDARQHHYEGAGRAGDEEAASAQQGCDASRDDDGDEAVCRGSSGRDGKRDGKRNRHGADDEAGGQIMREVGEAIAAQRLQQCRPQTQPLQRTIRGCHANPATFHEP